MLAGGIYRQCGPDEVIEKAIFCEKCPKYGGDQQFLIMARDGKLISLKSNEKYKKQFSQ